MGCFNNDDDNMGGDLINSVIAQARANLTADTEEAEWYNTNTWFGSLINAQKYSNAVTRSFNRERLPLIIEYMTGPVDEFQHTQKGYKNAGNRKAITMYINPSRMQFSNQKVVSESITRGGIFYHHWGDKNTVLSISGDLGLSSMAGVKKLDEIYRKSGVLLAYGDSTSEPIYYDSGTEYMNKIAQGNWADVIAAIFAGKVKAQEIMNDFVTHTLGSAELALASGNFNNSGLRYSQTAQNVTGIVGKAIAKVKDPTNSNPTDLSTGGAVAGIATAALGNMVNKLGQKIGGKLYSPLGQGALKYLSQNAVTFKDAFGGFSDISDELEDPWRPRLIWIYFENHVYIGHFQSFNYTRDASSVNIHYEMSFVIQREVVLTNFSPTLPSYGATPNGLPPSNPVGASYTNVRPASGTGGFLAQRLGF